LHHREQHDDRDEVHIGVRTFECDADTRQLADHGAALVNLAPSNGGHHAKVADMHRVFPILVEDLLRHDDRVSVQQIVVKGVESALEDAPQQSHEWPAAAAARNRIVHLQERRAQLIVLVVDIDSTHRLARAVEAATAVGAANLLTALIAHVGLAYPADGLPVFRDVPGKTAVACVLIAQYFVVHGSEVDAVRAAANALDQRIQARGRRQHVV